MNRNDALRVALNSDKLSAQVFATIQPNYKYASSNERDRKSTGVCAFTDGFPI